MKATGAAQIELTFSDPIITPCGDGTFTVRPGKVSVEAEEIPTAEVCRILKIARSQIWYDRDREPGGTILKWRFTGPSKRRILWERASVLAYKDALRGLGK